MKNKLVMHVMLGEKMQLGRSQITHIKSGSCFNVQHLLTNAQNVIPSRHDVVMLSTRTFL